MSGPLEGVKVIELAGLGALPFGSLKLADMGAQITRVDRVSEVPDDRTAKPYSSWDRGRDSVAVNLKHPDGVATVLRMVEQADVFLEAFRPGVAERLGLGPSEVQGRNERIVYGRLTGWGQEGPLASAAGHSLNYEAITGVTRAIGPVGGPPSPTLTLLGDFAGGGLSLAFGVACALVDVARTGKGRVIDAGMTDGVMSLAGVFYGMAASGMHTEEMGSNLFDGGAPFYAVYETADAKYVSIAPIEPHFYALLLDKIGLADADLPEQYDRERWPELKARLAEVFATRTRDQWCELLEGTDACFAPVLTFDEARTYPHNVERGAFVADGSAEMVAVPRVSGNTTPTTSPAHVGADTDRMLTTYGFTTEEIATLRTTGAIA